jgi:hypothetical protein
MAARFVLIHSPSVGPRTWQPVAHRLTEQGWEATVPSLLHVTDHGPPYWPRVVDAVRAGLGTAQQGQGLVLVAHSNAGLFLPVITAALRSLSTSVRQVSQEIAEAAPVGRWAC